MAYPNENQNAWQIWHCSFDESITQSAGVSSHRLHVEHAAWHPSPACYRIYAICDVGGNVHIVDGYQHAILYNKSWHELAALTNTSLEDGPIHPFKLQWSPDGMRLLLFGQALTVLVGWKP